MTINKGAIKDKCKSINQLRLTTEATKGSKLKAIRHIKKEITPKSPFQNNRIKNLRSKIKEEINIKNKLEENILKNNQN